VKADVLVIAIWHLIIYADPKRPTPSVTAQCALPDMIFDEDNVQLETIADGVSVSQPKDLFTALCSVLAMYWVFNIAYNPRLRKTLDFIANHVCKLESSKPSVAVQHRLNVLYSL